MAREGKLSRMITEETIRLELNAPLEWQKSLEEADDDDDVPFPSAQEQRERVIGELVEILLPSGIIQHQGRVTGDLVNRDCAVCHAEDDETPPPFELARYVPGGVMPELVDVIPSRLGGRLEVATDGRLELLRDRDPSSSYKALAEEQTP